MLFTDTTLPFRQLPQLHGELDMPEVGGGMFQGMQESPGNTDLVAMTRVRAHCFQVGKAQFLKCTLDIRFACSQALDQIMRIHPFDSEFRLPVAVGGIPHHHIANQKTLSAGEMDDDHTY